jgi:hypothetical protein
MPIEPFVTLAIDETMLHVAPIVTPAPGMIMVMDLFRSLGIPFVSIDGQLLPGTVIIFILAVWGAWHLLIKALDSIKYLPDLHRKLKRFFDNERNI